MRVQDFALGFHKPVLYEYFNFIGQNSENPARMTQWDLNGLIECVPNLNCDTYITFFHSKFNHCISNSVKVYAQRQYV